MDLLHCQHGRAVPLPGVENDLPSEGYVWIDIVREEEADTLTDLQRITGLDLHENHVTDSLNPEHPSFHDSTAQYDMLVFRSPGTDIRSPDFDSRQTTFFLTQRILITVRSQASHSVPLIRQRLGDGRSRVPAGPMGLMHMILTAMVDRFLAMRGPLAEELEHLRTTLLDPDDPMDDWSVLMDYRARLNRVELLCEGQEDAVTVWRDSTTLEFDEHMQIRFNDLLEHIRRVMKFVVAKQQEVESLIQIHFSAVAHRTNEVVRVLTVLSAIFLPLTLVAGIFGMNFEHMPELSHPYAYFIALGGMAALGIGLLILFRYKRWV